MKSRKMIAFGDITETVLSMLKTEADTIFGEDDKTKAESAIFMSGIINLWYMLDEKTEVNSWYMLDEKTEVNNNDSPTVFEDK